MAEMYNGNVKHRFRGYNSRLHSTTPSLVHMKWLPLYDAGYEMPGNIVDYCFSTFFHLKSEVLIGCTAQYYLLHCSNYTEHKVLHQIVFGGQSCISLHKIRILYWDILQTAMKSSVMRYMFICLNCVSFSRPCMEWNVDAQKKDLWDSGDGPRCFAPVQWKFCEPLAWTVLGYLDLIARSNL